MMNAIPTGLRSPGFQMALAGPICAVLVWEVAAHGLSQSYVLAAPSTIAFYLAQNTGLLGRALAETVVNAALGFVIGNLVAIALAACVIVWPRSDAFIRGLALIVFCLPLIATGPILRVIFGPGPWPQIVLAALAVYYTTLIPLLVGLRALPSGWLDLVRSYGRGRWAVLYYVRSMASLPYLAAGLQIAAPAALLGAMVGEFTGAERGVGVLTIRAMRSMDVDMTWALATLATAVAAISYLAVGWITRLFLRGDPPIILAAPSSSGTRKSFRARALNGLMVIAAIIALWWLAIRAFNLNPFFAKGPQDVFYALFLASDAGATSATLFAALAETSVLLVPGYAAGLLLGTLLAILLVLMPSVAGSVMPLAVALRSIPIIITAPLIVLVLGRGAVGTMTLVAIMVFFPTLIACLHGLRQAPGQAIDVFNSYAASRWKVMMRIRVPAMLPAFFAAARMSVPASTLAVTVVEWLATGNGIGSLMALSASLSDYNMLWSCVVVITLLSTAGYLGVGALEQRVLATYAPEQTQ
ncbi:MAG: ABC transporter permease subunit [Pseudomonadota bacterium]